MSTQLRATVFMRDRHVPNATVQIVNTELKGTSDANGYCLIDHIPFGQHKVIVSIDTISETYGPFTFKKGQSLTQRFDMQPFSMPSTQVKANQKSNN
jgi:hypothetical protein